MASVLTADHYNTTARILHDALSDRMKINLKKELMQVAEKEVDKVVNQTLKDFKHDIENYRENQFMRDVIHVYIHKKGFE